MEGGSNGAAEPVRTCDSVNQCLQSRVSHLLEGIQHIQEKHGNNNNEARVGGAKAVGLPPFLSSFFSAMTAVLGHFSVKKSSGDAATSVLGSSTASVLWEKDGATNAYPKAKEVLIVDSTIFLAPRPLTKEELGRCTWTLLHAIGAQVVIKQEKKKENGTDEDDRVLHMFLSSFMFHPTTHMHPATRMRTSHVRMHDPFCCTLVTLESDIFT